MDNMELLIANNNSLRDCCVIIITETWLHQGIPDAAVQLASRILYRGDRTMDSGKSKGGGLCMYVLNDWCSQSRIIESHCSPDIESMTVIFRPFHLPRELTVVVVTAVYIPPDANIS